MPSSARKCWRSLLQKLGSVVLKRRQRGDLAIYHCLMWGHKENSQTFPECAEWQERQQTSCNKEESKSDKKCISLRVITHRHRCPEICSPSVGQWQRTWSMAPWPQLVPPSLNFCLESMAWPLLNEYLCVYLVLSSVPLLLLNLLGMTLHTPDF